jgi:hypothetical protein
MAMPDVCALGWSPEPFCATGNSMFPLKLVRTFRTAIYRSRRLALGDGGGR